MKIIHSVCIRLISFLGVWLLLAGCSSGKPDLEATETHIAGNIYATLTAQAPPATNTLTPTPLPSVTSSPVPTQRPSATHTSRPSPLPSLTPARIYDAYVNVAYLRSYYEPKISNQWVYDFSMHDGLIILGRNRDCSWVEVKTPFGDTAWVNSELERILFITECESLPHGIARPEHGEVILDKRNYLGLGELTVDNGLPQDGFVLLTDPGDQPVLGFYVLKEAVITMTGIPAGVYRVYFTTGEEWDLVDYHFTRNASYQKMEEPMEFEESAGSYQVWEITLHSVVGGTADVANLQPDEFPPLE